MCVSTASPVWFVPIVVTLSTHHLTAILILANGQDFSEMFSICEEFNSDLSEWDTSSATNMRDMFSQADKFNSNLTNWDVSKGKGLN